MQADTACSVRLCIFDNGGNERATRYGMRLASAATCFSSVLPMCACGYSTAILFERMSVYVLVCRQRAILALQARRYTRTYTGSSTHQYRTLSAHSVLRLINIARSRTPLLSRRTLCVCLCLCACGVDVIHYEIEVRQRERWAVGTAPAALQHSCKTLIPLFSYVIPSPEQCVGSRPQGAQVRITPAFNRCRHAQRPFNQQGMGLRLKRHGDISGKVHAGILHPS